jgi:hypothetical protein
VENRAVMKKINMTIAQRVVLAGSLAVPLILAGCNPEGTGTVDVGSPTDVRSKLPGAGASTKPLTPKQAKALQAEQKEPLKNPKLD